MGWRWILLHCGKPCEALAYLPNTQNALLRRQEPPDKDARINVCKGSQTAENFSCHTAKPTGKYVDSNAKSFYYTCSRNQQNPNTLTLPECSTEAGTNTDPQ